MKICTMTIFRRLIVEFDVISSIRKEGRIATLILLVMLSAGAKASDGGSESNTFRHFRDCDACSEMIVLPSGKYLMGATDAEFRAENKYRYMYSDETPQHEEYVRSYALAKSSVTKKQFEDFAIETGFKGKGCRTFNGKEWIFDVTADWRNPGFKQTERDPVVCVSWNDSQKFIAWLNSKLPKKKAKYRLPTEREWEYAVRARSTTATYWGGNLLDQCKYENTRDLAAKILDTTAPHINCNDGYIETAPVGSFKPNPWGLFDMLGNANQWTEDCAHWGYYNFPAAQATNSKSCQNRALRGASWASIPVVIRSAFRTAAQADIRDSTLGFRLAVDSQDN